MDELMKDGLKRLIDMGFRLAGCWNCVAGRLSLDLAHDELGSASNVLYAFVARGEVSYIGKSQQTLRVRMYGYRNPGATQSTNIRNNRLLMDALAAGAQVQVYVLPDNGLLYYGGFHVNLAAGLEDSLIRELQPPWNGRRREVGLEDSSAHETGSR